MKVWEDLLSSQPPKNTLDIENTVCHEKSAAPATVNLAVRRVSKKGWYQALVLVFTEEKEEESDGCYEDRFTYTNASQRYFSRLVGAGALIKGPRSKLEVRFGEAKMASDRRVPWVRVYIHTHRGQTGGGGKGNMIAGATKLWVTEFSDCGYKSDPLFFRHEIWSVCLW